MPSNREVLDDGVPPVGSPPDPEDQNALRYGNALAGVWGTEESPSEYGTYLRGRVPTTITGIGVTGNTVQLDTLGAIVAVTVTAGGTGGKVIIPAGVPAANEVLVEYDGDGLPTLTFVSATECAVHQMQIPRPLLQHLDADATPE